MIYNSSNELNKTTARIYVNERNGNSSVASGFFLNFQNKEMPFLVTNQHVIVDAESVSVSLHSTINDSSYAFMEDIPQRAILHPQDNIDLCIIELKDFILTPTEMTMEKSIINSISEHMIITENETKKLNYCEDVLMFGSPTGLYDNKNNLSIAYKGMTATYPGSKYKDIEQFLVDIPSFPGSSGSAIYLCTSKTMSRFPRTKLLGIFCKAHYDWHSPDDKKYIHLGNAINAYKLLDFKELIK